MSLGEILNYKIPFNFKVFLKKIFIYFMPLWVVFLNWFLIGLFYSLMIASGCDTRNILNLSVRCPTFFLTAFFTTLTFMSFWLMIIGLYIAGSVIKLFEVGGFVGGLIFLLFILGIYYLAVEIIHDYYKRAKSAKTKNK